MALPPSTMHFSLDAVPEQDREETLRDIFGRGLVNMDFVPLTERPVLEARLRLLPGVHIGSGRHSPYRVTGWDISRENDDLMLSWPAGPTRGWLKHLGREILAEHGTAVLTSCAERTQSETHSEIVPVNVRVSRRLLAPLVRDVDDLLMRQVPPDDPALRLLGAYVRLLLDDNQATTAELDHALALHIADLVALCVGATRDAGQAALARGGRAARLAAVKSWIFKRLQDPGLTIGRAAAAQRVGPRCLQLLFEGEGTTFSEFVLHARLALARRQLCKPHAEGTSISTIAYGAGFGDLSYFNRAFRAAYGETPSDARQQASAAAAN